MKSETTVGAWSIVTASTSRAAADGPTELTSRYWSSARP
jgi:hypothetical protein